MQHHHENEVPGTIKLVDIHGNDDGHGSTLVLHPQPSANPEDPLNWSKPRKLWNVAMFCMYTFTYGIAGTVQFSILVSISLETGISLSTLNQGTGLMFLLAGWGCLIWQPVALTYGRRGTYIVSSLLSIGPMVWTAYTTDGSSWLASRALLGLFVSPLESLPEVSVADLFFAHERGFWMGAYAVTLFASGGLATLLAGFIANSLGWRAAIWFSVIVICVNTVVLFLGMEETMFFRPSEGHGQQVLDSNQEAAMSPVDEKAVRADENAESASNQSALASSKVAYISRLKLFQRLPGGPTIQDMLKMSYRPLLIFFYFPNVVWAGFLYGASICLWQVAGATLALVLSGPGYGWRDNLIGLGYIPAIIGSFAGWFYGGWVGDKVTLYLARKNNGIREPEQRLWVLLPAAIMGGGGLLLWGVGAAHKIFWIGPLIGLGLFYFGLVVGSTVSIAYNVDCFKDIAGESLVTVMIIRNTMSYGFAYGIGPWLEADGLQNTFIGTAFLYIGCTLSFVIMIFCGKRLRAWASGSYQSFRQTQVIAH